MDNGNSYGQTKYLFFYVGGCLYAIEAFKTLGVCEITSLTHWTGTMTHMIGITMLDDFIWPVMDLRIWLCNKKTMRNSGGKFLVVAIEDGKHKFLAVIDATVGMEDICANMVTSANELARSSYIKGYIDTGNVIAGLLSMEGMFDS